MDKMENLQIESSTSELSGQRLCQKVADHLRDQKPGVKLIQDDPSKVDSSHDFCKAASFNTQTFLPPESTRANNNTMSKGDEEVAGNSIDISQLEFEARSSKDGAWYDVDCFVAHRFLSSGEPEVRVRFVGFGAEDDEWINVKAGVRERSLPLENSECHKVKVGDVVLCFQERREQAIYYDAHVVEIQRRLHDVRGCRCLFLVRYEDDTVEASNRTNQPLFFFILLLTISLQERVQLRRLCCRPTFHRRPLPTPTSS